MPSAARASSWDWSSWLRCEQGVADADVRARGVRRDRRRRRGAWPPWLSRSAVGRSRHAQFLRQSSDLGEPAGVIRPGDRAGTGPAGRARPGQAARARVPLDLISVRQHGRPFREYPGGPPDTRSASWLAGHNFATRHIRPIFGEYYGDPDWVCLRPNCGSPSQLTITRKAFPTWARRSRRSFSADSDGLKRLEYHLSA